MENQSAANQAGLLGQYQQGAKEYVQPAEVTAYLKAKQDAHEAVRNALRLLLAVERGTVHFVVDREIHVLAVANATLAGI